MARPALADQDLDLAADRVEIDPAAAMRLGARRGAGELVDGGEVRGGIVDLGRVLAGPRAAYPAGRPPPSSA